MRREKDGGPFGRKSSKVLIAAVVAAMLAMYGHPAAAQPRETVQVTGSSTVFPFTSAVASSIARAAGGERVQVTSTGTVHGFAQFCRGSNLQHPDVQNASRRMTAGEFSLCVRNGVNEIMEIPIGFDGIVVAHRRGLPSPNFTLAQLWMGMAKEVPQGGRIVPNPFTSWRQISASLPDWPISVIGPPRTSGTRDSFTELAMLAGCRTFPEIQVITDAAERTRLCSTVREDGGWVDGGEDDQAIVRRVTEGRDGTLGVFGFSFLQANRERIEGSSIEGVDDAAETIASGRYPLSRPLFLYVKRPNLERVPGLKEFLAEYVSDGAMGSGGYLLRIGLVPVDSERLLQVRAVVRDRTIMMRRPND
ncbi:substrate-binding domain-containing protein [Belnapia sp. T18]|uniref:Substrate-binding domain-containing protein n=1 Tax=Belnapia arida TaxID=2804533 RepID=A0ABS1U7X8_9PROT|nr:substrate-binding domain-containing protein [Belnapia arida]MBL6080783.1 substrate-binding domain-containing protein [Belnapia arida]